MPGITCPKCGRLNGGATGEPNETCPYCGVIYAKARAAAAGAAAAAATVRSSASAVTARPRQSVSSFGGGESFAERLRSESNYPTFRAVAALVHIVGAVVAVLMLLGGLFAMFTATFAGGIGGIVVAALIFVVSKAFKEASIMLADLSDATLRMAQRQEEG